MNYEQKLKLVYEEACKFLGSKVSKHVLNKQLNYYYNCRLKTVNDIFYQLIGSLKNKQSMPNSIGDINELKYYVFNFNPRKVNKIYENDWKALFKKIKDNYIPPGPMDIKNERSYWVIYVKGILSSAKFLSNFNSVKEFDKFVKSFFHNEFTIAALPMLLDKEIFGLGFSLACDFLKELGYVQYGKPDVHIKDIFYELGLVSSRDDYEVFKTIVKIGYLVNKDPVIVDKIFWLIGSGKFYKSSIQIGRQKKEFIKMMQVKLKIK
ncbi:MAG: hypothetical protein Q7J06_01675 [Bacteroidales bacterium]|nr:hypothetical protein [Bacteroidales bacterium]